jgi:hypothetical protein
MRPCQRRSSWLKAWSILGVCLWITASCGGGGSSGTTNYQPSIGNGSWLVIDLTTGSTTAVESDPGIGSATTLVLARLDANAFIGVTEISKGQWTTVMGTAPWSDITPQILGDGASGDPARPANNISFTEAQAFIAAIRALTRLSATLPTAAQYQEAIGPGPWPWGSATDAATVGPFASVTDTSATVGILRAVGTATPANGFYDIIGNVREWTTAGTAFGGSSLDSLKSIQASPEIQTVGPTISHPLYGLRLACLVQ